jgi:hypothetical protein
MIFSIKEMKEFMEKVTDLVEEDGTEFTDIVVSDTDITLDNVVDTFITDYDEFSDIYVYVINDKGE